MVPAVGPTSSLTMHERHIPLEGAVNFRDLGGYETTDGRKIRWRTLFRADGLSRLTDNDRATMRQLGVATVIDLRSSHEVKVGASRSTTSRSASTTSRCSRTSRTRTSSRTPRGCWLPRTGR